MENATGQVIYNDRATTSMTEILFTNGVKMPFNWFLSRKYENTSYPSAKWFNKLMNSLGFIVSSPLKEKSDALKFYVNMSLSKSDDYMKWFHTFKKGIENLGFENTEYYDKMKRVYIHEEIPWEEGGVLYDLLDETGDYFWFICLLYSRYGSIVDATFPDLFKIYGNMIEKGHKEVFDMEWFDPLRTFIKTNRLRDEFEYKNVSIKSFDFSKADFSKIEPDDISNIPEYDIEDMFIEKDGDFYSIDKALLAITASGGLAQSLERQDLEPSITNVSNMIKRKKKKNENRKTKK